MADLGLDLSGIRIRLAGLPEPLAARIRRDWKHFVLPVPTEARLRMQLSLLDREAPDGPYEPQHMTSELEPTRARFELPEGSAEVDERGAVAVRLARGLGQREFWTWLNFLRASLAWLLPRHGAALLHAAGLVVEDRAYLLVGPEGAGKSSWARLGEQAGARVLSDDIVLVDGGAAEPQALGSPFRSTHFIEYRPGRWPLAAVLFPRKGEPVSWTPVPALLAAARIAANLPFVSDALERDEKVASVVERLATAVPCLELTFGLDASFLELLRAGP